MSTNEITITGNATRNAELRFTTSGQAVANFAIAHTRRRFNKAAQQWEDASVTFLDVVVWGSDAEAVASQVAKGTAVVVVGRLEAREWTDKTGNQRTSFEITADTVGRIIRPDRRQHDDSKQQSAAGWPRGDAWGTPSGEDAPF